MSTTHEPYIVEHANMWDGFSSSAAVARFLRGAMTGWSHELCDRIDALEPGQTVETTTIYGPCTVRRQH